MAFWSGKFGNKGELTAEASSSVDAGVTEKNTSRETVQTQEVAVEPTSVATNVANNVARKRERLVPEGMSLSGRIFFDLPAKIEGKLDGEVFSASTVTVTIKGELSGTLEADTFEIYGKVNGELHARERVVLHSGAEVEAKIVAPKLKIEAGAFFNGECRD